MGLDMYLYKERYYSEHQNKEQRPLIDEFDDCKSITVRGVAIYWRKANSIHQWFVDNIQDGVDDCGKYYFSEKKMRELLNVVNEVLEKSVLGDGLVHVGTQYEQGKVFELMEKGQYVVNPQVAQELLPTTKGFYFGSTDYDNYYIDDLIHTKTGLEKILNDPNVDEYEYYYQSSW